MKSSLSGGIESRSKIYPPKTHQNSERDGVSKRTKRLIGYQPQDRHIAELKSHATYSRPSVPFLVAKIQAIIYINDLDD